MNFLNLWHLTNMEMGLIMIEISVLLSLFIPLIYFRRNLNRWMGRWDPPVGSVRIREWAQESEIICRELSKNLEEKKEIIKRLMAQLDQKIQTLQISLKMAEEEDPLRHKVKDPDSRIYEMADEGCDVPDIARLLGLSQGEVQLTLDLKRYRQ